MRRIFNSFFYGGGRTKSYLWTMLLLAAGAAGFLICAFLYARFSFAVIAFILAGLDVLIFRSVTFKEIVAEEIIPDEKAVKKGKAKLESGRKSAEENSLEEKKPEEKTENDLEKYDEKMVKKLMLTYKVKKDHKKAVIDLSVSFRVHQCPAYFWKEKGELRFLLLEKEPRIIKLPLAALQSLQYEGMAEARPSIDYEDFKKPCFAARLFSEYLPEYHEFHSQGKRGSYKNLYILKPDLKVSAASARNLFEMLPLTFEIPDEESASGPCGKYYMEAYKYNILWKDSVITIQEYKEKVRELLTGPTLAGLSRSQYEELLRLLVEHKMITREYAAFYREFK